VKAPALALRAVDLTLELGERPWLMGIVNASPDSFSDGGLYASRDAQLELARSLLAAGADILDVGGESASTGRPPVDVAQEIERVVPLVRLLAGELGALVSVDTYKPAVAGAPRAPAARRRQRRDRRRRADRQRRQRAARSGAGRRVRADGRRARDHAHARRSPRTATGPRPLRRCHR
jgi:hypothetical protein